jgi:hypothetical protein
MIDLKDFKWVPVNSLNKFCQAKNFFKPPGHKTAVGQKVDFSNLSFFDGFVCLFTTTQCHVEWTVFGVNDVRKVLSRFVYSPPTSHHGCEIEMNRMVRSIGLTKPSIRPNSKSRSRAQISFSKPTSHIITLKFKKKNQNFTLGNIKKLDPQCDRADPTIRRMSEWMHAWGINCMH